MIWKTTNELTKRERDVLPLLALPYKEIAKRLGITSPTVRSYIASLSYKFPEQPNKLCIVLEALKQGIITLDEIVTEKI
jgi:DNA-binding NarL/FixJ family response regulator